MAIDLDKLKKEHNILDTGPLNETELGYVEIVEKHIDDKINKDYNSDNTHIYIDLTIANFKYNPATKSPYKTNITNRRRTVLFNELVGRYEKSGWCFKTLMDDGRDGNMSGGDYLILIGK